MSLSAYLAKNYLTASTHSDDSPDSRPTKKRKKNRNTANDATSTLIIADDDDLSLSNKQPTNNEEENDGPMFFDTKVRSAEFRKSKKNAWKTLSTTESVSQPAEDDEADALLRETIESNDLARANLDAENAPTVVEDTSAPKMESGIRAGLQTAADTARLYAEEQARESNSRKSKKSKSKPEPEEETIYRDATGRRIDLTLRRAEIRKQEADRLAAEKKAKDDAMGEVQLQRREERKQELEDAKFLTLGRGVDDEEYNDRLKESVRWDDPMARYMAQKKEEEDNTRPGVIKGASSKSMGVSKPRRKEYVGAAAPNRYGIRPGWRWDGVDRGNGFEKDWFLARGRKARNENLEYQWQMDE